MKKLSSVFLMSVLFVSLAQAESNEERATRIRKERATAKLSAPAPVNVTEVVANATKSLVELIRNINQTSAENLAKINNSLTVLWDLVENP